MGKWRAGVFLLLLLLTPGSAAAQFDTPWEGYDTVAVGNGQGGALWYSCASDEPSRGAVMAWFHGVSVRDGLYRGAVGDIETRFFCVGAGSRVGCLVNVAQDVARIRDVLIRRNSVTVRLGSEVNATAVAVVGLRGSAAAIARVQRRCR